MRTYKQSLIDWFASILRILTYARERAYWRSFYSFMLDIVRYFTDENISPEDRAVMVFIAEKLAAI